MTTAVRTRILFAPLTTAQPDRSEPTSAPVVQDFWSVMRATGPTELISRLTRISRATQTQREPVRITIDPMAEHDHHFAVSAGGGKVVDLSQVTRDGIYDPMSFITGYPNKSAHRAETNRARQISESLGTTDHSHDPAIDAVPTVAPRSLDPLSCQRGPRPGARYSFQQMPRDHGVVVMDSNPHSGNRTFTQLLFGRPSAEKHETALHAGFRSPHDVFSGRPGYGADQLTRALVRALAGGAAR